MENFILIYRFTDAQDNETFGAELKNKFPKHKVARYDKVEYFTFPAKHQPAVKDEVNLIIHRLGIGSRDYVALYFTRPQNPDEISREMLLGKDEYLETDLKRVSKESHNETLAELLESDFLKA